MDELTAVLRATIRDEVVRQLAELGHPGTQAAPVAPVPQHLLTIVKAAGCLRVKTKTLYEWRRLRKGPPTIPVGRLVKYRAADLDTWLAESRARTSG
jgi:predicted DNA-binding transcriptional regulator AlpA